MQNDGGDDVTTHQETGSQKGTKEVDMRINNLLSNVQRPVLLPRILGCSPRIKVLLVSVALSSVWVPGAGAACGSSVQQLSPSVFSAVQLPPPLQEATSDGVAGEEPQRGGGPS